MREKEDSVPDAEILSMGDGMSETLMGDLTMGERQSGAVFRAWALQPNMFESKTCLFN